MNMYQRILAYVKPYWIRIVIASICAIGVSGTTAAAAWLVQPALDKIFIQKNVQLLLMIPFAILIIYFIKGLCNYYQSYLMRYVGNRAVMDIRNDLFSHIAVMPIQFYTEHSTGKLMSRLLNDVGIINNAASTAIKDLVQNVITVIALLGVVFYQDWRLAAISCLVLPFAYYPLIKLGRKLRQVSRKGQEEISGITDIMHETFSGASVVKAFGMEESEVNKFRENNFRLFRISMKGVKLAELSTPVMEFIGAGGASLIIWYGGYQVVQGITTPGTFFSFLAALIMMYSPLRALTRVNSAIQQSLAAAERVFSILDLENEKVADKGIRELNGIMEVIEFRNVSFRYESSSKDALSNVSFSVPHGKTVAIVGSSGGGKTTIGNLLLRFYEPDAGGIYIDGTDIRDFSLRSLRNQIGIVSQDVILFNDTVLSNISYGKQDISMEDTVNAAKKAYAHDFISRMAEGYNTEIGERGAKVSGGEKQRIAIARAILKDPPILILDEATSALDTESEHIIQMALDNLMIGRTTFVIAHRLSTIKNADLIIALDGGRIAEMGRHEELLRAGGLYKKLYDMQFTGKE